MDIYLNAKYIVKDDSDFIIDKYGRNPSFILDDTANAVLGKKWLGDFPDKWNFDRRPIVLNFLARMSNRELNDLKNYIIVYGKVVPKNQEKHYFGLAELFLFRDLELEYDIKEFRRLIKKNQIKIKTL
tara:strand:- start:3224 stop:3607 length:384 start_codon:yes stop_codon:yes gene_type:complete